MIKKRGTGKRRRLSGGGNSCTITPSHGFLPHIADSFYTLTAGSVIN
jgi:hypothetical protein